MTSQSQGPAWQRSPWIWIIIIIIVIVVVIVIVLATQGSGVQQAPTPTAETEGEAGETMEGAQETPAQTGGEAQATETPGS